MANAAVGESSCRHRLSSPAPRRGHQLPLCWWRIAWQLLFIASAAATALSGPSLVMLDSVPDIAQRIHSIKSGRVSSSLVFRFLPLNHQASRLFSKRVLISLQSDWCK